MEAFNCIGKTYLNEKIIVENDVVILFALFKKANSFQYIDEIGYYYFLQNNDSITNTKYDPRKANKVIHSIFTNIKILYEKTEDTFLDKYLSIFKLLQGYKRYKKCFSYIDNIEYVLIKKVINIFLNSKYISLEKKIVIKKIRNEIFKNKSFILPMLWIKGFIFNYRPYYIKINS